MDNRRPVHGAEMGHHREAREEHETHEGEGVTNQRQASTSSIMIPAGETVCIQAAVLCEGRRT